MAGEGANIQATVLTGGESTRGIGYDESTGRVTYPRGVDPTSVLGRVADMQWAMTKVFPKILAELTAIREALEALTPKSEPAKTTATRKATS